MDIKRILVPTDFSMNNHPAIEAAQLLAARFGATVDLLHVWNVPVPISPDSLVGIPPMSPVPVSEWVRQGAEREMERLVAGLRARGVHLHGSIAEGDASDVIVRIAAQDRYDLIVMGTHGRTGLARVLVGSVAERVVRRASCPVMTVREPQSAEV